MDHEPTFQIRKVHQWINIFVTKNIVCTLLLCICKVAMVNGKVAIVQYTIGLY
jgi:hypothetical protein